MKNFLTSFLLAIYLFSFTEAREVLKFPNLIEHYISHKISNKNTSIFSFIKMHYLDDQVLDSDFNQDMKLPFKKHDFSCYNLAIQDLPKTFEFYFSEINIFEKKDKNFYYFLNFSEGKSFSFYPPPKFI